MAKYIFEVKQFPLGNGTHSWEAIDTNDGTEISFLKTNDGNGDMVGKYPAIEKYMMEKYGVSVSLCYDNLPSTDYDLVHDADYPTGGYWLFRSNSHEVTIFDASRIAMSITISRPESD